MEKKLRPPSNKMETLIRRYNPILKFHPKEQNYPISIESYLANSDIAYYSPKGDLLSVAQEGPLTQRSLFDFSSRVKDWTGLSLKLRDKSLYQTSLDSGAPVYVNYFFENDRVYVNFIYLFGWDNGKLWCLNVESHQADLEHLTMEFSTEAFQTLAPPNRVYLSTHGQAEGRWMNYSELQKQVVSGVERPVAYCAQGSHGMYGQPGEVVYFRFGGFGNDNTSDQGPGFVGLPVLVSANQQLPYPHESFNGLAFGLYPFYDSLVGDTRFLSWRGDMGEGHVSMMPQQGWWNTIRTSTGAEAPPSISQNRYRLYTGLILSGALLLIGAGTTLGVLLA